MCSASKNCPFARFSSADNVCRDVDVFGNKTVSPNYNL
jgi:hypothetical protein